MQAVLGNCTIWRLESARSTRRHHVIASLPNEFGAAGHSQSITKQTLQVIAKLPERVISRIPEQKVVVMKRPALLVVILTSVYLYFCAPSVLGCVTAIAAVIFGFCLFDQLLSGVRVWAFSAIHRQSFKPPANTVAIGVILSVVCAAIGLFWNPQTSAPVISFRIIVTMLSVAGHMACLGALAYSVTLVQAAPYFRKLRG